MDGPGRLKPRPESPKQEAEGCKASPVPAIKKASRFRGAFLFLGGTGLETFLRPGGAETSQAPTGKRTWMYA